MIRIKNIDYKTDGMKISEQCALKDVTATANTIQVFVAPQACIVTAIDVYNNQVVPNTASAGSSVSVSATIKAVQNGSANIMGTRFFSATALNSDVMSANQKWNIPITGNNSLTQGTPIQLLWTNGTSGNLSAAIVVVTYQPINHRETR